jgi:glyoxylase-like metal-dependent hydrolase (beta-lactamase superfamily II)
MSKTLLLRLAAAVALSAGLWIAHTQNPQNAPQLTVEKVKDGLWVLTGDGGNVAVCATPEGVILIDDKFERDHAEILAKVKSVTSQPIRYVVNTHQHGDHTGGNVMMLASAEIIAHRNARANMVAGKLPGPPRISFSDETSIFLGGTEVRAHYFGRGHTNGDAVIYFPASKTIHAGDLYVSGTPFIDYAAGASAVEWTATLDKVLHSDWDFDTVIPGHGPVARREDLVKFRAGFEAMRNRVAALLREGKGKDDVVKALTGEFGWGSTVLGMRSVDGLIAELRTAQR